MSFFKNNKTNTNATTETTNTEETTNNGGGLLTTLAVAGGTILGITAAVVGGKKLYKHFNHEDEEIIDSSDDSEDEFEEDDDFTEVTENEAPVENFKEVETEEPVNETPVKAEEVKTEETKKPEPAETKETETMKFERLIGEAVSKVPYDKPETVDLAYYVRCMGGYLHDIDMEDAGHTGRFVIAEHCIAMTNLVISAIAHMASGTINDLEDYHGVYGDIQRLVKEFKASKIMKFTTKPELCEEMFDETLDMAIQNLKLTKQILNLKEAKPAGENQTADKVDGKTKSTENCFNEFKEEHKDTNKVEGETKSSTKASGKKQTKAKASKTVDVLAADPIDVINQFAETSCEELVKSSLKALASLGCILDVNDQKPCEWLHEVAKYVDSNIDSLLKTNHKTEAYKLMKVASRDIAYAIFEIKDYMIAVISAASTIEELDDAKESVAALSDSVKLKNIKIGQATLLRINDVKTSLNNMYAQLKSAGETKTAEPVVDEKQATTKESPSETQIGNSTVVSDDGETVTLKAMVSQESIDNVNDVINIVSKIPNREHPELNDMGYMIRVIGGRIHGIKEPEATFIAYDEATNSNKFIDACTDVCRLAGKAICNLANSGKNPLASMQWIDRCTNELVASGIIDNTYDPNTYRAAILKAHKEAMDALSKLVSGETKTDTNDNVIDKINTILGEINPMVTNDFDGVTSEKFIEKIRAIDELIGRLDKSKRSKSMIKVANSNINIAVRMFCDDKRDAINECDDSNKIEELAADVSYVTTLKLSNIVLTNTTLIAINKAIAASQNKADEIMTKNETQDLVKASDETQTDAKSSDETQAEDTLTYTMSEKIQEAVQQSDETAATVAPEPDSQAPMSPEASSLASKLQEVGALMRAEKWSEASEFYKSQLTPYLADDGLSKELRNEIMGIKTKATNMLMSQKQLEAKQKTASAKASKKGGKRRRRH